MPVNTESQWSDLFLASGAVINFNNKDFIITHSTLGSRIIINDPWYQPPLPPVSLPVAAAMGAAAVIMKNPVVSRRFWKNASND